MTIGKFIGIGIVTIFILSALPEYEEEKRASLPLTPQQKAEKEKLDAIEAEMRAEADLRYAKTYAVLSALKESMYNPKSFELASAILMEDGTLCISYRGTNVFGGVVRNNLVVNEKISSDSVAAWNRYCAEKSGYDMSHVGYLVERRRTRGR
jgi:hypothetical protein